MDSDQHVCAGCDLHLLPEAVFLHEDLLDARWGKAFPQGPQQLLHVQDASVPALRNHVCTENKLSVRDVASAVFLRGLRHREEATFSALIIEPIFVGLVWNRGTETKPASTLVTFYARGNAQAPRYSHKAFSVLSKC